MTVAGYPDSEAFEARPLPAGARPRRILAIRLQAMGDTLITLPYLAALAEAHPEAEIDFLTRKEVAGVPRHIGLFRNVWTLGGGRSGKLQALSALALLPRLLARRYDVVVDLQRNRVSRFVRRLLRPGAFSEFDRYSLRSAGARTAATLEAAGLGPISAGAVKPVRPADPALADALLAAAGWDGKAGVVVLNPAGALEGRHWPTDRYVALALALMERAPTPVRPVLVGVEAMRHRFDPIARALEDVALDLVGRTTPAQAHAIVARAAMVVTEDSGLMHMAWISGTPTLALFAASPTVWSRPLGPKTVLVDACRRDDGGCMHGWCAEGAPGCLAGVGVEEVLERALEMLGGVGPADPPSG